jgi:hypothetical protein
MDNFYDRDYKVRTSTSIPDYLVKDRNVNKSLLAFFDRIDSSLKKNILREMGIVSKSEYSKGYSLQLKGLKLTNISNARADQPGQDGQFPHPLGYLVSRDSHGWSVFDSILLHQEEYTSNDWERNKLIRMLWKYLFPSEPEQRYKELQEEGCWDFPDFDNTLTADNCASKLKEEDFLEEEKSMHRVPRIFELVDYFRGETEYKYNETFKTHCCHFRSIPYFHFAMDSCKLSLSQNFYDKVKWLNTYKGDNKNFFRERYPRVFAPSKSKKKGHEFISEGERKMAYLFRQHFLGKTETYDEFKGKTKVVA